MASVAPTDAPGLLEAPSGPSPIALALRDGKARVASQSARSCRACRFPVHRVAYAPTSEDACQCSSGSCRSLRPGVPVRACNRPARSGNRSRPECSDAGARDLRAGGGPTVAAQIQNPGSAAPSLSSWSCPNTIVFTDRGLSLRGRLSTRLRKQGSRPNGTAFPRSRRCRGRSRPG